ncbi:MAG: hypothetical protein DMF72_01335 [Acidobacteria bacterium]|nr:MAG: hypothetical protein DMF72_01335 [Acidobacteriota bacterium]
MPLKRWARGKDRVSIAIAQVSKNRIARFGFVACGRANDEVHMKQFASVGLFLFLEMKGI